MICKKHRSDILKDGMTLSETVIAIGVIAFAIPLILAATGNAHQMRQAAEADTRAAWLVRDVQRRIMNEWSESASAPSDEYAFPFPVSSAVTMELSYMWDGTLIPADADKTAYLAIIEAEPHISSVDPSLVTPIARIRIKIQYPAKAAPKNRKQLTYQFLSTRNGMP